eukprot:GEMP01117746.1.p1 GENE.GEMP01117746.1~~GEMP01117746.1.p1  ORF type:complete len:147 (+),score=39.18 GEMP01117746.1:138-578(+)
MEAEEREKICEKAQTDLSAFYAARQAVIERRKEANRAQEALYRQQREAAAEAQRLAVAAQAATAATAHATGADAAVLVREQGATTFRRVLLDDRTLSGFSTRVCEKFKKSCGIVSICRIRDQLELCDDDDIGVVNPHDELEVAWAS